MKKVLNNENNSSLSTSFIESLKLEREVLLVVHSEGANKQSIEMLCSLNVENFLDGKQEWN